MIQGADYSGGRPSGAALKKAGFDFVIRYVGLGSPGKLLTAAEYRDLIASGVEVLLVAELGTGDSWGTSTDNDYSRGRANATAGLNHARNCGVPDSKLFIFGASDAHAAAQWQIDDTVDYIRGFRDVLSGDRAGHYGFSETQRAVRAANVCRGFWRCGSKPSTAEQTWVNFWQRNVAPTTKVVAGVVCDINDQYHAITTTTEDDDMQADERNWLGSVWSATFVGGGENPLKRGLVYEVADMQTKLTGLTAALTAQTKLIVDNEANDITPENLAAALKGLITSELVPVVHDVVAEAFGEDNAEQAAATAAAIIQNIGAMFTKSGGTLAPTNH